MNYEELLSEADKENIYVIESADFESKSDGLINGNVIGLSRKLKSSVHRSCVLAEELGHHYTNVGNIIDQSDVGNRKQEYRARSWAYNKQVGLFGIIKAYQRRCQNLFEMAEFLGVTEEFLSEAIDQYRKKYGCKVEIDNYVIFFEPRLAVMERMNWKEL